MSRYRKPDYYITFSEGERVADSDEYLEAWRTMIRPVAEKLGLICYAFDPDFVLRTPDSKRTIDLPVWFVKRLVRVLEGLPAIEETEELARQEQLREMDDMRLKWQQAAEWLAEREKAHK